MPSEVRAAWRGIEGRQFGLAFDEIATSRRRQYGSSPDSPLERNGCEPFVPHRVKPKLLSRGTGSSNPTLSSGESANFRSLADSAGIAYLTAPIQSGRNKRYSGPPRLGRIADALQTRAIEENSNAIARGSSLGPTPLAISNSDPRTTVGGFGATFPTLRFSGDGLECVYRSRATTPSAERPVSSRLCAWSCRRTFSIIGLGLRLCLMQLVEIEPGLPLIRGGCGKIEDRPRAFLDRAQWPHPCGLPCDECDAA